MDPVLFDLAHAATAIVSYLSPGAQRLVLEPIFQSDPLANNVLHANIQRRPL